MIRDLFADLIGGMAVQVQIPVFELCKFLLMMVQILLQVCSRDEYRARFIFNTCEFCNLVKLSITEVGRIKKSSPLKVGLFELSTAKVGFKKIGLREVAKFFELRAVKAGVDQCRAGEVCVSKPGSNEVSMLYARSGEVGGIKPRLAEVYIVQYQSFSKTCLTKFRGSEIRCPAEACLSKVGIFVESCIAKPDFILKLGTGENCHIVKPDFAKVGLSGEFESREDYASTGVGEDESRKIPNTVKIADQSQKVVYQIRVMIVDYPVGD